MDAALEAAQKSAKTQAAAAAMLSEKLGEFGFPAEGSRRLVALRVLVPALMAHLDGDPSPVPDRHAFVESTGEVRVSGALNSERIENASGAVLYLNLRTLAELIRQNSA